MGRNAKQPALRARVAGFAKGGDGIVRVQVGGAQRTLFVPGTAPGDEVEIVPEKGSRARLLKVLEPSALRVQPACPHHARCGGCDWMHVTVDAQRAGRTEIVALALAASGFSGVEVVTHDAKATTGYRGRARFGVQAKGRAVIVGLRAARRRSIVPVASCLVLRPELDSMPLSLREWLVGSTGTGEASVTLGAGGRPAVHLLWNGSLAPAVFAIAQHHVDEGRWAGASVMLDGASQPAVIGDARGVTTAADGLPMIVPAGGFMQASESTNWELVSHVVREAAIAGRPTLELFAGSGNITVMLARETEQLETVEQESAAVEAARENLGRRSLAAKLRVGDADAVRVRDVVKVVVLDPPRAGAAGAVTRIVASKARRVVMVSCDPATLARDASLLRREGGFELQRVDAFEMFPHTSHVETVAVFVRGSG